MNYDAWSEHFTTHCNSFGVLGFLDGTITSTSTTATEWNHLDSLVKVWIYDTISTSLLQTVLKKNVTAKDVWKSLKELFHDNKDARAMELQEELRLLELGNLTISEYFKKIKMVSDLLSNIESPVDENSLVMYAINGHGERYEQVAGIIRHKTKRPTLLETRSMLLLEESRLNRRDARSQTRHNDTLSSSTVLMATGPNPSKGNNQKQVCRNFQRGHCRFGAKCRYLHVRRTDTNQPGISWNSPDNLISSQQPLNPAHIAAARQAQPAMSRVSFGYQPPTPRSGATQQSQPTPQAFGPSGILGPHPSTVASVPNTTTLGRWVFEPYGDQPSYLPQAFNAMSLQYPDPDSGWYMDTGATSHLSADTGKLTTIFNKSIIPSIVVGNGATIPVTNSGRSILPSLHRPLYLQNVLVTSNIIKNLISVRQFTRDNKCSIDFDEYGFSVKDYWTRRLLLRCNSTGDLYPFLPSTISTPTALLSTKHST
ncbi:ribonuclease H-like domain-containing protein [Tanacetum coccineum]|uniref:Ribonuclease H-like domain-containing protein n=1 Tax=Tanacetum coccineum TaxID=301880 RepID=A0ABQ5E012_9ASTR